MSCEYYLATVTATSRVQPTMHPLVISAAYLHILISLMVQTRSIAKLKSKYRFKVSAISTPVLGLVGQMKG